ncbi:MAG: GHMP kinase [Myxococcota bacterium]
MNPLPEPIEVPGRLCLFGEHSDWAAGYRSTHPGLSRGQCLVAGTDQSVHARIEPLSGCFEISSLLPDGSRRGPERIELSGSTLQRVAAEGGFFSYAAGVAATMVEQYGVEGLRLELYRSDLPLQKGLSSSAAICVLVARAFSRAYGLGLSVREEMELAYRGERRTGSECGRMDQICALGRRPSLLTLDGESLEIEPLTPGETLWLLIVDLGGSKDTRRILSDLNACFPDTTGSQAEGVRQALGPRNAELVGRARRALVSGCAEEVGGLMTEAQSLFDSLVAPASRELRAPRLHELLAHPACAELAWGGKGVGSQGDGCAQLLVRGSEERDRLAARLQAALGVRTLPLTIRPES